MLEQADGLRERAANLFETNEQFDYKVLERGNRFDMSREARQLRSQGAAATRLFFRCLDRMKNRPEAQVMNPVARPQAAPARASAPVRTSFQPGLASGVRPGPGAHPARSEPKAPVVGAAMKSVLPSIGLLPDRDECYVPVSVGRAIA